MSGNWPTSSGSSDKGGIGKHLEKIGGLDLVTAIVLAVGAYTIYGGLNYTQSIFSVSLEPGIIAVQLSGLMAIVYLLEFKADEEGNGRRNESRRNHTVGQKIEEMASMDVLTLAALALNAYVLYEEMSFFTIDELMEPGGSLTVIALQASAILGVFYILEFRDDSE